MISGRVAPILIVALGQFVAPAVWHKLLRFSLPLERDIISLLMKRLNFLELNTLNKI